PPRAATINIVGKALANQEMKEPVCLVEGISVRVGGAPVSACFGVATSSMGISSSPLSAACGHETARQSARIDLLWSGETRGNARRATTLARRTAGGYVTTDVPRAFFKS